MNKTLFFAMIIILFCINQNTKAQTWNQLQKILASDGGIGDNFGYSVSIDGNTAVVGAYQDDDKATDAGAAYVFELQAGTWVEVAKLTAADGASHDRLGYSVAISGNTVVAGAYVDDDNGSGAGSAYVFEKPLAGWAGSLPHNAKLTAADGASNDLLGFSVNISGNTVVAGANQDDDNGSNSGSAYVFEKPLAGWAGSLPQNAKLTAADGASNDNLGMSVAISGNTVVVGAWLDDDNGSNSGSAYVFEKPLAGWAGTLPQNAKLTATDGTSNDYFSRSVAISGNTVVAGAYLDDDNGSGAGSAYVFEKPLAGWAGSLPQNAKLTATDGASFDQLGRSVAISGNTVVAGAFEDDDNGSASGSAYVFEKPLAGWAGSLPQNAKLTATDGASNDWLGYSVAISGNTVVAGAYRDSDNGSNAGSAYFFEQATLVSPTITNYDPNIADPCTCFDPNNILVNGQYYFHELVTITAAPSETWAMTSLNSGQIFDVNGNDISANVPIAMNETPPGSGIYTLDFWHLPATGYSAEFNRIGNPLATPLSMSNSCLECNNIPTTSEWGLLIFGLSLACVGIMVLRRRRFLSYEL